MAAADINITPLNSAPHLATCQELGYFNRATPPVARLPAPLPFNKLVGQAEYRLRLQQLYKELQV